MRFNRRLQKDIIVPLSLTLTSMPIKNLTGQRAREQARDPFQNVRSTNTHSVSHSVSRSHSLKALNHQLTYTLGQKH